MQMQGLYTRLWRLHMSEREIFAACERASSLVRYQRIYLEVPGGVLLVRMTDHGLICGMWDKNGELP
jgi:hypothetical protein